MSANMDRIKELFDRYYNKQASSEERKELMEWIATQSKDEELSDMTAQAWEQLTEERTFFSAQESEAMKSAIIPGANSGSRTMSLFRQAWFKWSAAAAILIIILAGAYRFLYDQPAKGPVSPAVAVVHNDIPAPQTNRAMIKMADGKIIYLDSANAGTVAMQDAVSLVKLGNGAIAYEKKDGAVMDHLVYNTLVNPRGSQVIHIRLADGTMVWLNAGSSITYPLAFMGGQREVSMEGEAYFEVTHDPTRPFIVKKGDTRVQVLGTHFNVNAYDDEPDMKVTLLEGSVKVNTGISTQLLKPGEQARIKNTDITLERDNDMEAVMAWKNGRFFFQSADIHSIMRQVARWYDVDITIEGKENETFSGSPPRTANISELLNILAATSKIKYEINGKKLTIQLK